MDDEDYMSDAFLQQSADVRPGLLTKSQKRKTKGRETQEVHQASKKKKLTVVEAQNRDQGLATPISEDNKGFALLEKMGYRKGSGIAGKKETALIPLVLKDGRSGLGRSSFLQEQEKQKSIEKKETEEQNISHFLQRKQQTQTLLRMEGDLRKSQKACEQLDSESGYSTPIAPWYWASVQSQADEDENSDDSENSEEPILIEKIATLTDYLRDNYFYCVWCGTSYQSEEDLCEHCPGNTWEKHDSH